MRFQCVPIILSLCAVDAFTIQTHSRTSWPSSAGGVILRLATEEAVPASASASPPPVLNGKMVLPYNVIKNGLEGHKVSAVYAIMDKTYKRGQKGWKECVYVGTTLNLQSILSQYVESYGAETVAHVRALSFSFPQKEAMEEIANDWRQLALEAGAILSEWDSDLQDKQIAMIQSLGYGYDDEDDDEDDDDDIDLIDLEMMGGPPATPPPPPPQSADDETLISPFASSDTTQAENAEDEHRGPLEFSIETVDKILDEVRPYLISDGGNVTVVAVDTETKNVYLKLEGACGSCASSTVTMQMGIERVLKENFEDLGEVLQVSDEPEGPTELTLEAVEQEVNRVAPAITAMGGVVEILNVDPIGVVELKFRGANKVKQGLELALLDIPYLKHVKFVMDS